MVGLKIKEYLDENGIKYSYLSERTGMPMNILSPTLNGKRKMSAEEYFMICKILGLSAETFAPDETSEQAKWVGGGYFGRDEEGNGKNERPDKVIAITLSDLNYLLCCGNY